MLVNKLIKLLLQQRFKHFITLIRLKDTSYIIKGTIIKEL